MILMWLSILAFAALVPWGTSAPSNVNERAPVIRTLISLAILFHLTVETVIHAHPSAGGMNDATPLVLQRLTLSTTLPAFDHLFSWLRIITSSLIIPGWVSLVTGTWLIAVFGFPVERKLGSLKMAVVAAGILIIPSFIDWAGLMMFQRTTVLGGGFTGVLYGLFGAYLVLFPRSSAYVMGIYDLRFWATVFIFLMPAVTWIYPHASDLSEIIFLAALAGLFLVIQPEGQKMALPIVAVMGMKMFQDLVGFRVVEISDISVLTRLVAGIITGGGIAFYFNGSDGFHKKYPASSNQLLRHLRPAHRRPSLANMESAARKTPQAAALYLGSRVFVGDTERAGQFYREFVMTKFPSLVLSKPDQLALARMLEFKGMKPEALHAYRNLLRQDDLPKESEIAYLNSARLISQLPDENPAEGIDLLDQFDVSFFTQRDRVEADKTRARLEEMLNQLRPMRQARSRKHPSPSGHIPGNDSAEKKWNRPARPAISNPTGNANSDKGLTLSLPVAPLRSMKVRNAESEHKEANDRVDAGESIPRAASRKVEHPMASIDDSWSKRPLQVENINKFFETRARKPPYIPSTDLDIPRIALRTASDGPLAGNRLSGRAAHIELTGLELIRSEPYTQVSSATYATPEEIRTTNLPRIPIPRPTMAGKTNGEMPGDKGEEDPAWLKRMMKSGQQDSTELISTRASEYGEPVDSKSTTIEMLPLATVAVYSKLNCDLIRLEEFASKYIESNADAATPLPNLPRAAGERHSRFLLRRVNRDLARTFKDEAEKAGLEIGIASEENPLMKSPADEITSLAITNDRLKGHGWTSRIEFKFTDVAYLSLSRLSMMDSRGKESPRLILDIILRDNNRRIQIFERTVSPPACRIESRSLAGLSRPDAIIAAYNEIQRLSTRATHSPMDSVADAESTDVPTAHSFLQYDENVICGFFTSGKY